MLLDPYYQVTIVGGGPAGSALALLLAQAEISVLLIEKSQYEQQRVGELLSSEGIQALRQVFPKRCEPFLLNSLGIVAAWDSRDILRQAEPGSWAAVDRLNLDRALAHAAQQAGATLVTKTSVPSFALTKEGLWNVNLSQDGQQALVQTPLLIDATGRASRIGKLLGAFRRRADNQTAIVAFLDTEGHGLLEQDMLIETTYEGWWYAAPVGSQSVVTVFISDIGLNKGEPETVWKEQFLKSCHIKERFGAFKLKDKPKQVAAENSIVYPSCGENWLAIGDAAACPDPFSNRGIGRVLLESLALSELIIDDVQAGKCFSPFQFAEARGRDYNESLSHLKNLYRKVRSWPGSLFWSRRQKVQLIDSDDREATTTVVREAKFFYAHGQNFSCNQCGKCCRSGWSPEVEIEQIPAIRTSYLELQLQPSLPPLRQTPDGTLRLNKTPDGACVFLNDKSKCSLVSESHQTARPKSCDIFPFILRETPDGIQVGVSFLCSAVKKNEGAPLIEHESFLREFLQKNAPRVITRQVPISYGRSLEWKAYQALEQALLRPLAPGYSLIHRLKQARWHICLWVGVHGSSCPQEWDCLQEDRSPDFDSLERTLAASAILHFVKEQTTNEGNLELLGELLHEAAVIGPSDFWIDSEVERYIYALVERKFLLVKLPLIYNLCLVCLLATLLKLWTHYYAKTHDHAQLQMDDYARAINTFELGLVTFSSKPHFVHLMTEIFIDEARNH